MNYMKETLPVHRSFFMAFMFLPPSAGMSKSFPKSC